MRKHYKNETPRFPNVLEGLRSLAASRCVSALRFSMSSICFQRAAVLLVLAPRVTGQLTAAMNFAARPCARFAAFFRPLISLALGWRGQPPFAAAKFQSC